MAGFFDLFPKVAYDIAGKNVSQYETVTNVFFRVRVLRKVLYWLPLGNRRRYGNQKGQVDVI